MSAAPAWLRVQAPSITDPSLKVHIGEAQAILLAKELKSVRLLMDDQKALKAAQERGILTTRTPALLVLAAEQNLIDLSIAFDRLKKTNFRARPDLLDEVFRQFESMRIDRQEC